MPLPCLPRKHPAFQSCFKPIGYSWSHLDCRIGHLVLPRSHAVLCKNRPQAGGGSRPAGNAAGGAETEHGEASGAEPAAAASDAAAPKFLVFAHHKCGEARNLVCEASLLLFAARGRQTDRQADRQTLFMFAARRHSSLHSLWHPLCWLAVTKDRQTD
jgi:hypothetical protein